MRRERCRFSLTASGKSLFAFGGVSEKKGEEGEGEDIAEDDDGVAQRSLAGGER